MEIEIEIKGKAKVRAKLDERNPKTAQKIYEALPIEGEANIWLDEVYFQIPVDLDYENPASSSKEGDISFWPPGKAFCIFYGESQPASEVNHIGLIIEGLNVIKEVKEGDGIVISRV